MLDVFRRAFHNIKDTYGIGRSCSHKIQCLVKVALHAFNNSLTCVVFQWDLVCWSTWKRATSQSLYMLGFLLGAVGLGGLSDR